MPGREFVFAHLADAHVGAWPRDPGVRKALRESVLRAIAEVSARECEFLLVSGDLFHTPVPDPEEAAPVAAALRGLTDVGRRIYVIYGSHDYVAHRTSWLDVLAESGLFLRSAPAPIRAEGERWTLPYLVDAPTGARIAGISGRAQGLDRGAYLAVDSESFRTGEAFRIFQFHAAVREYLPAPLRDHIEGVSVEELPPGVDYYAGGHIHSTYLGPGPGGTGLLVNPGAVFGTSVTDIEAATAGRTHRGVAIVRVARGEPQVEFVDTAPKELRVFDVDLTGIPPEAARARVHDELAAHRTPGALLFPRLRGTFSDGTLGDLGLGAEARSAGPELSVHWDLSELAVGDEARDGPIRSSDEVEREVLADLAAQVPRRVAPEGSAEPLLTALLAELGQTVEEGQSKADYETQRIDAVRRALVQARRAGR